MIYSTLSKEELTQLLEQHRREYNGIAAKGYKVDIARGKPCNEQLDIAMPMLSALGDVEMPKSYRNYGIPEGIPEMRKLFAQLLGLNENEIIVGGNSSLNLMYDAVQRALQFGVLGSRPWNECKPKFLCPVPGYDRHFGVCQHLGIEMINIPMDEGGPNLDLVERLVASDDNIKGMWCVPKYSNPSGVTYSDETVARLARMETAADDFRIFWDNAYCVHDLTEQPDVLANIMTLAKECGHADRIYEFTSTSKITFAGGGVSCIGASEANIKDILGHMTYQTIGYDKITQYMHFVYLQSMENITDIMAKQRAIVAPKFTALTDAFEQSFGDGCDVASWTKPNGGYFIALTVLGGCASRVGKLCKEAGLTITPPGAPYPYGKDDTDSVLRIAPTFTSSSDLAVSAEILISAVKVVCLEKLLETKA